jgi:CheY-like chemotaxis protein
MEAINLVQKHSYDIVFMDHMMPEMDGIEATEAIRAMGFQNLPIVALTANAVSGMREMFLEKGFNDYLAKPIEIAKLNETIKQWIPKDKQQAEPKVPQSSLEVVEPKVPQSSAAETTAPPPQSAIRIPGIDVTKGVNMTGGSVEGYKLVLSQFYRDAETRLPCFGGGVVDCNAGDIAISAHALKSAAATIGAEALSKEAAELEAAGKTGDMDAIDGKLPDFYTHLKKTIEEIQKALDKDGEAETSSLTPDSSISASAYTSLFGELKESLERKDIETVDRLIAEIDMKPLDMKTKEIVRLISDQVLRGKFKMAVDTITTQTAEVSNG